MSFVPMFVGRVFGLAINTIANVLPRVYSANMRHSANVGLLLGQRRRHVGPYIIEQKW